MASEDQRQAFSDSSFLSKDGINNAATYLYSLDSNNTIEFCSKTLLRISIFSSIVQLLTLILLIPSYSSLVTSDIEILLTILIPILNILSLTNDLFTALSLSQSDSKLIKKSLAGNLSIFFLSLLFLLLFLYNSIKRSELQQSSHPLYLNYYSIYTTINMISIFALFFIYQILRFYFLWKSFNISEKLLSSQNT